MIHIFYLYFYNELDLQLRLEPGSRMRRCCGHGYRVHTLMEYASVGFAGEAAAINVAPGTVTLLN